MAKITINNGDSAADVRTSLNSMFTQLYSGAPKYRGNSDFSGGTWYSSLGGTSLVNTGTAQQGKLHFGLFICTETATFDRISWVINASGVTGAQSQCAVYAPDSTTVMPTGAPLAYSTESTGVAAANVQVIQTFAGGSAVDGSGHLTLSPGPYWVCEWHSQSGQTVAGWSSTLFLSSLIGLNGATAPFGSLVNSPQWQYVYSATYSTGSWPTLTGSDLSGASGGAVIFNPVISMRVVS